MNALSARDGYRLWGPRYETETAVSRFEDLTIATLGVPTSGRSLLDVGCGTGRRLRDSGAANAVGVDLTVEMLREVRGTHAVAAADVRALPFPAASFDVVWCRLVLGHLRTIDIAYAELSRVCRPIGVCVVTDLSPKAIAAGHRRTFRDADGTMRELEHFVHSAEGHIDAARRAGLEPAMQREGIVGPNIRQFYADTGRLDAYEAQFGLPLVVALSWRKRAA